MSLYPLLHSISLPRNAINPLTHPSRLCGSAMAAAVGVAGQVLQQSICSKPMAGLSASFPFKRICQLEQKKMKIQHKDMGTKRTPKSKLHINSGFSLVMSSMSNSNFELSPLSLSETIMQFYAYINDKNLKQLSEFIAHDCSFDDSSFPNPFQGKKEVMHFFEQLTASMGKNVKFSIRHVCCGEFTAVVHWHLEWKKTQIPFTRGCSFYEFTKEGEKITIKNAQAVIESPIKPGSLVLTLLKIVASLFDDFPKATEWLLKSHHDVLHRILYIYTRVLLHIINPLLAGYANFWNFMVILFRYTLKLLLYILYG